MVSLSAAASAAAAAEFDAMRSSHKGATSTGKKASHPPCTHSLTLLWRVIQPRASYGASLSSLFSFSSFLFTRSLTRAWNAQTTHPNNRPKLAETASLAVEAKMECSLGRVVVRANPASQRADGTINKYYSKYTTTYAA